MSKNIQFEKEYSLIFTIKSEHNQVVSLDQFSKITRSLNKLFAEFIMDRYGELITDSGLKSKAQIREAAQLGIHKIDEGSIKIYAKCALIFLSEALAASLIDYATNKTLDRLSQDKAKAQLMETYIPAEPTRVSEKVESMSNEVQIIGNNNSIVIFVGNNANPNMYSISAEELIKLSKKN